MLTNMIHDVLVIINSRHGIERRTWLARNIIVALLDYYAPN